MSRSPAGTRVPALLALGCLLVLGACTSSSTGAPQPGAVPAPPVRPSVTAAPAPTLAALPDPATSNRPVVAVTATRGPAAVGTVDLRPGRLWISLDCVAGEGPGELALILEPGPRFDLECPADEVYLTRNLDQDHLGGQTSIRVETGPGVRWNLLVEQEPS
ncbi:hypothetical protein [Micromonospora sp. NBC_01813]|uniref:hypothetical protein n=1 Tax=Micromonospora sp. NBC_01813 TaxID=2975988 RepID=UPI002DD7C67A|nr:hypothetical protein [Micromonospora sp. NBC_01813]WSA09780.1 hypothetical protein OG958_02895 [Micromonospora sp. NBC_01813]